ncbi:IscS subfamily cysteine desulfurase [Puia dinghuensis]|uniref:Cysteine desulfurase IscS n=1 Tax=Puia dinghuensis TaxID=1792502 RepID=A0A8J2UGG0_9BACT|nr:IscS subfamily cysteine desulfurase [Puia dinghuensis]GGB14358.1 cysteine desulfurase IscS [Puia dinghuensis]
MNLPIYLDYNSTTPVDPRVLAAMLPYFTQKFGNAASRSHAFGWEGEEAVEIAREQVARFIGAEPKEIVFTSGATEGDNLALKGVFESYAAKGNHIITVVTEHKAVLDSCHHIQRLGGEVTFLPVDAEGLIDLAGLEAAIRPSTVLVAVMYANNEIGVIQPIRAISAIARRHGILFFTDATQAVGKVPVDVNADGIDLLTMSAHKIYGPKGIGALYVRRRNPRVRLAAQMDGGGHERGMRSGTLNVPAIVGLGKASELCQMEMAAEAPKVAALRDRLETGLLAIEGARVNGSREHRLPQVTNISFPGVDGEALLAGLGKDVALSSGSACTSASMEPSYVLKALGVADDLAHSSLRLGLGRFTTAEEVDYAIGRIRETVEKLRERALQ